eukprot:COSAG03_NODE_1175_length_4648_cov_8.225764_2_plen_93_part_00
MCYAVLCSAQVSDTIASEYLKDSNTAPLVPLDTAEALKQHGVHLTFPFERDPSLTQDKLRARTSRTHTRAQAQSPADAPLSAARSCVAGPDR